jgi:hypothetical protein
MTVSHQKLPHLRTTGRGPAGPARQLAPSVRFPHPVHGIGRQALVFSSDLPIMEHVARKQDSASPMGQATIAQLPMAIRVRFKYTRSLTPVHASASARATPPVPDRLA